jgi:hypothetical protein
VHTVPGLFKASPERYAPQYGGYGAYGVGQDRLAKIEPNKFRVNDGERYPNCDAEFQRLWLKHPNGDVNQADAKFPTLLKQQS